MVIAEENYSSVAGREGKVKRLGLKPQAVEEHHKVIFRCPVYKSYDRSSFYILHHKPHKHMS